MTRIRLPFVGLVVGSVVFLVISIYLCVRYIVVGSRSKQQHQQATTQVIDYSAGVPSIQQRYPATAPTQYSQTNFGPQPFTAPFPQEPAPFSSYPAEGSSLYPNTGPSLNPSSAPKSHPVTGFTTSNSDATTSAPPPSYSAAKAY